MKNKYLPYKLTKNNQFLKLCLILLLHVAAFKSYAQCTSQPEPLIIGTDRLCQGSSLQLSSSAVGQSYIWKKDNVVLAGKTSQSISVNETGNYTVEVTFNATCKKTSVAKLVALSPVPTITATGSTTICTTVGRATTVVLTSSSASAYRWSNGATTQSITVSDAGSYYVTAVSPDGCTQSSASITVTSTAQNPVSGTLEINNDRASSIVELCSASPIATFSSIGAAGGTTYFSIGSVPNTSTIPTQYNVLNRQISTNTSYSHTFSAEGLYYVFTNAFNGCGEGIGAGRYVRVSANIAPPQIGIHPSTTCLSGSNTISFAPVGYLRGTLTGYVGQTTADGVVPPSFNVTPASGVNVLAGFTVTIPGPGWYMIKFVNTDCGTTESVRWLEFKNGVEALGGTITVNGKSDFAQVCSLNGAATVNVALTGATGSPRTYAATVSGIGGWPAVTWDLVNSAYTAPYQYTFANPGYYVFHSVSSNECGSGSTGSAAYVNVVNKAADPIQVTINSKTYERVCVGSPNARIALNGVKVPENTFEIKVYSVTDITQTTGTLLATHVGQSSPVQDFQRPGVYMVEATISNTCGASPVSRAYLRVFEGAITPGSLAINGSAANKTVCNSSPLTLSLAGGQNADFFYEYAPVASFTAVPTSWNTFAAPYRFTSEGIYAIRSRASNGCTEAVSNVVYVKWEAPAQPGTLASSLANVCLGGTATITRSGGTGTPQYSISAVSAAGSELLSGGNIGLNTFNYGPINRAGTYYVRVNSSNACGLNTAQPANVSFTVTASEITSNISGNSKVCPGALNSTYSIPALAGAAYTWTVPNGASIVSGQNTGSIVVNFGSAGGNISVVQRTSQGCISAPKTLAISIASPPKVKVINGPSNLCSNAKNAVYYIDSTQGSSYLWGVPNGFTMEEGQGTNRVEISPGRRSGTLTVIESNNSGCAGTIAKKNITVEALPSRIEGPIRVVIGTEYNYSVENKTGYHYTWNVSNIFEIIKGQGTNSITVRARRTTLDCNVGITVNVKSPKCDPVKLSLIIEALLSRESSREDGSDQEMVTLFPNPFSTVTTIQINDGQFLSGGVLSIVDNMGHEVYSKILSDEKNLTIGSELQSGSYVVRIKKGDLIKSYKLIKIQ